MISNIHFLCLMYFSPHYGCQMAWSKLWQFWSCCSKETKFLLLYLMETMEQCDTIKSMENAPICDNYLLHNKKFTWHPYSTFRLVLPLSKHFTWTVHSPVNHVHFFLKAKSEYDSPFSLKCSRHSTQTQKFSPVSEHFSVIFTFLSKTSGNSSNMIILIICCTS